MTDPIDWTKFDELTKKQLELLEKVYQERGIPLVTDTADDVSIEFDEGHVYMTLEGDLVYSMLKYLVNNDANDSNYGKFTIKLHSGTFYELRKELA